MVYRVFLGPKFHHDWIFKVRLSRNQPVITRVNKQIRAESLSIYYAENSFWLEVDLRDDHLAYLGSIGYVDFCRFMENFTPAQAHIPGIQNPLHHIRNLEATFILETYIFLTRVARFEKKADRAFKNCSPDSVGVTGGRLGGDDTGWADRTSVDALVKQWFEAENCRSPTDSQERFIHAVVMPLRCKPSV